MALFCLFSLHLVHCAQTFMKHISDGWKILTRKQLLMKPEGLAEHHQTLSSWVAPQKFNNPRGSLVPRPHPARLSLPV